MPLMPGRFRFLLPAAALYLLSLTAGAATPEEGVANWCRFDLPPIYIATGPDAGKGTVDQAADFLMQRLPQYEHRSLVSNIRRFETLLRNGDPVVCAGMQKNTERENYMLFSEPLHAIAPPQIVVPRRHLPALKPYVNADGSVQLASLITNRQIRLGVAFGRSYGRDIDELVTRYKGEPQIIERTAAQKLSEGLLQMAALDRIDYMILFGSERDALLDLPDAATQELVSLPISGQPRFITVHLVAPRTPWGERFIERANQVIRANWNNRDFRTRIGPNWTRDKLLQDWLRELDPNRTRRP